MNADDLINRNIECCDRFTFDFIFRLLLSEGFSHDEALEFILYNCCLSAIIFQERIDNKLYKEINLNDEISSDLLQLKSKIYNEMRQHSLN